MTNSSLNTLIEELESHLEKRAEAWKIGDDESGQRIRLKNASKELFLGFDKGNLSITTGDNSIKVAPAQASKVIEMASAIHEELIKKEERARKRNVISTALDILAFPSKRKTKSPEGIKAEEFIGPLEAAETSVEKRITDEN